MTSPEATRVSPSSASASNSRSVSSNRRAIASADHRRLFPAPSYRETAVRDRAPASRAPRIPLHLRAGLSPEPSIHSPPRSCHGVSPCMNASQRAVSAGLDTHVCSSVCAEGALLELERTLVVALKVRNVAEAIQHFGGLAERLGLLEVCACPIPVGCRLALRDQHEPGRRRCLVGHLHHHPRAQIRPGPRAGFVEPVTCALSRDGV